MTLKVSIYKVLYIRMMLKETFVTHTVISTIVSIARLVFILIFHYF